MDNEITCETKQSSKHSPLLGRCIRRSSTQQSSVYCPSSERNESSYGRTPNSSPARSSKKLSGIQSIWATLKKFSPVQKLKHSSLKRNKRLDDGSRLSCSHPDISSNNLAALTNKQRSHDDLRVIADQPDNQYSSAESKDYFNTESLLNKNFGCDTFITAETRHRLSKFRQYPFFQIEVHLESANNLLAKDSGGTSDPYVKFKIGNKIVYKSRIVSKCLDPQWDEFFAVLIEDVFQPLCLKVYDYDFGFQDDYLGGATIDLTKLELNKPTRLVLDLTETGTDSTEEQSSSWGQITLTVTLIPKTQEEKEQHFEKGMRTAMVAGDISTAVKRLKTQVWDSVVNIVLVEGKGLSSKDENGLSDPYVKFKLGSEKYKSKVVNKSLNPVWNEQFDLHTFPDQSKVLEVSVYDKDFHGRDDFMGKFSINLTNLPKEKTLKLWRKLEGGDGSILLFLTISGTLGSDTISDLSTHEQTSNQLLSLKKRYGLLRTFNDLDDVGHLTVKVFKAEGLLAADFSGKSDPFCVIELCNARVQTHTEYKTLSPEWNKIFTFQVRDIHEVLEVTVYDEDKDKKVEFLGKVCIPLLKIKNGEKKWYTLKDKKLMHRSKGRILLEMSLVYNITRACIRTINPREVKVVQSEQKFKRSLFLKNVTRLKAIVMEFVEMAKFINSCFQWESVPRSISAFIIFILITYFFELYMAPIALLLIFLVNFVSMSYSYNHSIKDDEIDYIYEGEDEEEEKEGKPDRLEDEAFLFLKETVTSYESIELLHATIIAINDILGFPIRPKDAGSRESGFRFYLSLSADKFTTKVFNYFIGTDMDEEEKKTLKEKFQTVQEVTAMVQNILGDIASLGERVKNTFNFSVPFLSCFAIIALSAATIILYHIPLRWLIMAWGINKFTKKLRNPNAIPNNEILDFLSRVPDNEEKLIHKEFRDETAVSASPTNDPSKKGGKKKTS
ncbi:multiple C2 and transmembrane domain-containing protein 1-like isoform X8 [Dinothrombium tinctorium]|uniref:Multiple C2 and transmembrane domain-containing protein 1-like isoform X8 n=1 Tax=Dinothrombium tinctorium TaxID=1965070 RepID=A0A3S3Q9B2_9ACAR|nr:multiple C2 and transmembrane domain-containing protein 1-like isoform X8 [Dinothrombium tinctorium]RWS17251.1 multiple C2 and transmembrane domain-containing protein 1-like isoform X8 [Dinothrombium tinctorium]RWS17263.1 multiple C2 and transmembrane domain-containing protein 1-like isoform X8 [Dinothrombium tinctorium]